MRSLKLLILFTLCFAVASGQVVQQMGYKDYSLPHVMNIGAGVLKATDSSAVLELGSDNSDKGVLLPRAHRSNIVHPKKGLAIYDLDWNKVTWFNGANWDTSGSAAAGAANYNFDLPIQVAGNGHITLPGWHAPKWDSAFYRASFDTLTRYLRLTDISGASTYIYIPKGSTSGLDPRITDANISFWKTALSTNDTAAAFSGFLRGKDTLNLKYRLDTMLNSVGKTSILDFSGGLIQNGTHVTALSDINYWNAGKLQGTPIASTLPTVNQLIGFNGSQYAPITPHLYSTINQITDTSFTISRADGSQDTVAFSLPLPNTGIKLDTSAAYINNIVLQNSGLLHTSPATFNYSNHTATLTQVLANQNPYTVLVRGAGVGQPSFQSNIDSNWVAGLHTQNYYNTLYPLLSGSYSNPAWINTLSSSKITGTAGGVPFFNAQGRLTTSTNVTNDSTQLTIGGNIINYQTPIIVTNTATVVSGKNIALFNGYYSNPDTINKLFSASNVGIWQHDTTKESRGFLNFYNAAGANIGYVGAQAHSNTSTPSGDLIFGVTDGVTGLESQFERLRLKSNGQVQLKTYAGTGVRALNVDANGNLTTSAAAGGGSSYTLPIASASTLGGVKIGSGISVAGDGTISATGSGTAFTDFKEEFTSQTTTTKTLLHTPAYPAATLLFYNKVLQSSSQYSISGTTLTLNFTPTSTDTFTLKYSY